MIAINLEQIKMFITSLYDSNKVQNTLSRSIEPNYRPGVVFFTYHGPRHSQTRLAVLLHCLGQA